MLRVGLLRHTWCGGGRHWCWCWWAGSCAWGCLWGVAVPPKDQGCVSRCAGFEGSHLRLRCACNRCVCMQEMHYYPHDLCLCMKVPRWRCVLFGSAAACSASKDGAGLSLSHVAMRDMGKACMHAWTCMHGQSVHACVWSIMISLPSCLLVAQCCCACGRGRRSVCRDSRPFTAHYARGAVAGCVHFLVVATHHLELCDTAALPLWHCHLPGGRGCFLGSRCV